MRWVTEYLLKVFVRCYVSSNYYGNITNYPNSSTSAFGKLSEWTIWFTEKHLSLKTPCKNRLINYRELCHSVPINVQGIRVGMRLGISETIFFLILYYLLNQRKNKQEKHLSLPELPSKYRSGSTCSRTCDLCRVGMVSSPSGLAGEGGRAMEKRTTVGLRDTGGWGLGASV